MQAPHPEHKLLELMKLKEFVMCNRRKKNKLV